MPLPKGTLPNGDLHDLEPASNQDADAPTLTRESTSNNSVGGSSNQSLSDSPATSVDDLEQSKGQGAEEIAGHSTSDNADLNEDSVAPQSKDVKETSKQRRRNRARVADLGETSSDDSDNDEDRPYYGAVRDASELSSTGLYQAYLDKLQLKAAMSSKKKNHGSNLIKGFVDYVRVLEDRIGNLELKVSKDEPEKTSVAEEGLPVSGSAKMEDVSKDGEPERKWADIELETRCFNAETEINEDGNYIYGNTLVEGTYTSTLGQKHLIRALYDWSEDLNQGPPDLQGSLDREQPNPNQIDLLEISITSEPLAMFFKKKLSLDSGSTVLVRLAKPFRPLLHNLQTLKDHLVELEEKYRSDDPPQSASEKQADGEETAREPDNPQPEDDLPFPPSSQEEEKNKDSFDYPEAIDHFRILLQFVEKYLSKAINLLAAMRAGKVDKIPFEHLWMLFGTGDTLYCPHREGGLILQNEEEERHITKRRDVPQGYQVLSTVGGCPQRKAIARRPKPMFDGRSSIRSFRKQFLGLQRGDAFNERMKHRYLPLYVYCFYIDFDGSKYGTVTEIFVFKPYEGEVDVRSLEVYPVSYLDARKSENNKEVGSDFLLKRGRKFIDMTTVSHMTYEGLTVGESREEINSTVIVDFSLAYTEYKASFRDPGSVLPVFSSLTGFWHNVTYCQIPEFANSTCNCCAAHDRWAEEQKGQREKMETKIKSILEDYEFEKSNFFSDLNKFKQYMETHDLIKLLPGMVPCFALRNRRWIQVDLSLLEPVTEESSWDKLVLPKGHKEMVQAMVETHAKVSNSTVGPAQDRVEMDLVRGKGKGCIILLHGAPGVGKTSTAECVAAHTKRPLYPITCGDIGYLPEEVEKNMENHFKLAHKWGCVLLLDEADVLLAKRSKEDIKRNGLVSVFLRILEYYSGILFLTTNRVGAIDDAFRSRLHLTLYYPKLTKKQTISIWSTNLEHVHEVNEERKKNSQLPIEFNSKNILKWVKDNWETFQWNGRQIRNAFQTAIALAEFKARPNASAEPQPPVMKVHLFEVIATASVQFNHYLSATHGLDEDKMAKRDMIRTDVDSFKMVSFKSRSKGKSKSKSIDTSDESEDSSEESEGESEDTGHHSEGEGSDEESEESEKEKKKKKKSKKSSSSQSKSSKGDKSQDKKKK